MTEDPFTFAAPPAGLRCYSITASQIKNARQAWDVTYPLCKVLFLVLRGTIANGPDDDDIVD